MLPASMTTISLELTNRLKKNLKTLIPWANRQQIEAYRIYNMDLPNFPFAIDIYGSYVLIHDRRQDLDFQQSEDKLEILRLILSEELKDKEIVVKVRRPQRGQGDKSQQYSKSSSLGRQVWVREGHARFLVNIDDYVDTGLFLDHRRLRALVHTIIQPGQSFLNLFCYTGSMSVWAALAQAETRNVDLSKTYMRWAQSNFKGNGLDLGEHEFVVEDVLNYIKQEPDRYFDVIYLDPPTFSNSKSMNETFEVERDQLDLLEDCKRWLKPEGLLIFSNNKKTFKLASEVNSLFKVRDMSQQTLPKDFGNKKMRKVFFLNPNV